MVTCRQAIAKYWPPALQAGAITVMTHENGSERPDRKSAVNYNGTYDYGCFQVNSVHFHTKGWNNLEQIYDPSFNAQIAYKIYQSRGWRAWYAVQNILWK